MKNWKYINGAQVGNADVVKDGNVWVVLYAEGTKSKEFNSEAEAKKFAAQVGNANITPVSKPNAPVKDPKKDDKEKDKDKKPSDPKDKEGYTFKERVKQVTGNSDGTEKLFHSLEKDVEKKEEKNDEEIEEVGNSKAGEKNVWKEGPYHIEQLTEDGNFGWYKMPKGSFVAYRNDVVYGNFKTLDEAKRKLQDEINKDKEYNRKYTTNSKTGNSLYAELNKNGKRVVIEADGSWYVHDKNDNVIEQGHESNADNALGKWKAKGYNKKIGNAGYPMLKSKVEELSKEGKSYEEVVKELLKFGFTRADIAQYEGYIREHIGNKKVGNALFPASKYDDEIHKLEVEYQNVSRSGGNPVEILKKTSEIEKRIQQLKELRRKETGNAMVGNSNYRYKGYLITKSDEDGEIIVFKPNGRDIAFRGTKSEDMAKDWIDHHSVGNKTGNSASDDKFAYVMREFDEGKLKTPDGKVVTDPAQAKAIAYSESKKAENGCARARNAMKCGNWNSERSVNPVGQYRDFIKDIKNAIMLDVAAVTYNGVDEQTLKSWVEQAKKEGYASAIKGVQGKKVILDTY